jgi:hypothetical protein
MTMQRRYFLIAGTTLVGGAMSRALAIPPCTPTPLNATGGTSASTACGATGSGPAWFQAMADKTWSTVAATARIRNVLPNPYPGGTDSSGIIAAWGGATVDTTRQELQILAQGGHNDYHGNEVYVLPLNTASPAWARVSNPRYSFGGGSTMDDGSPAATHGRSFLTYAANVDRTFIGAMSGWAPLGNSSADVYAFNRATNTWQARADGLVDQGHEAGGAEYDPVTGHVWIVGAQAVVSVSRFDPVQNRHTPYTSTLVQGYVGSTAIAPSRRILMYLNGHLVDHNGTFRWFDMSNPTAGWRLPAAVSGTPLRTEGPALRWHEASGSFIGWGGGTSLFRLTPPANLVTGTWVWSQVAPAGGNSVTPSAAAGAGTWGRFNIVENLGGSGRDCIVLINSIDQATYVYKLPTVLT